MPRDGKQITAEILVRALEEGYGLSWELADVLAYGGYFLLGQRGAFQLNDLARHNKIEHDASLTHPDTHDRDEYAPLHSVQALWKALENDSTDGQKLTAYDIGKARVRREAEIAQAGREPLDSVHAEIARGEMAIALGLFSEEGGDGIPLTTLETWMIEERLPDGWKPTHVQGLWDTIKRSKAIREAMVKITAEEKEKEANVGLVAKPVEGINL